jgi:hypothetical protein
MDALHGIPWAFHQVHFIFFCKGHFVMGILPAS